MVKTYKPQVRTWEASQIQPKPIDKALAGVTTRDNRIAQERRVDVTKQSPDRQISGLMKNLRLAERQYVSEIRGKARPEKLQRLGDIIFKSKTAIAGLIGKHPEFATHPIAETELPASKPREGKRSHWQDYRLIRANRKGGKKLQRKTVQRWSQK